MYGAGSCAVRRGSGPSRPFGEELLGLRSGLRKAIALPMIMRTHDQSSVEGHNKVVRHRDRIHGGPVAGCSASET